MYSYVYMYLYICIHTDADIHVQRKICIIIYEASRCGLWRCYALQLLGITRFVDLGGTQSIELKPNSCNSTSSNTEVCTGSDTGSTLADMYIYIYVYVCIYIYFYIHTTMDSKALFQKPMSRYYSLGTTPRQIRPPPPPPPPPDGPIKGLDNQRSYSLTVPVKLLQ